MNSNEVIFNNSTINSTDIEKVETKKTKRKNPFKVFKSRYFTFIFITIITLLSAFALFLLDEYNTFKPAALNIPFFKELFKFIGIKSFNVEITSWTVFIISFGVLYGIFIIWAFFKPVKRKVVVTTKDGVEIEKYKVKKAETIYNVIFFGIIGMIYAFFIIIMVKVYPWHMVNFSKLNLDNFLNLLASIGILFLLFLLPFLILILLYLLFRLLVALFILFGSAVSKGVMKTQGYQEALAASQITNQRLQSEVEKVMKEKNINPANNVNIENISEMIASGDFNKLKNLPIIPVATTTTSVVAGGVTTNSYPEFIFPALNAIDQKHSNDKIEEEKEFKIKDINVKTKGKKKQVDDPNNKLKDLPLRFQAYLANKHNMYFSLDILRSFIAGLSASRIILLEGLSGTGKTTLPRLFNTFIGGKSSFFPVQSTWRDKTDLMGYFSDFTKQYKETDFLKSLYEGIYIPNKFNFLVLDEMNISRVEYYFADFLSILEYPKEDWTITLINVTEDLKLPNKLEDGKIRIPDNTWFIGTINVDDSTFTISDKVYDRAIVIEFKELSVPFKSKYNDEPINMTPKQLQSQFDYFTSSSLYQMSNNDKLKFIKLCDFTADLFDIKFGNRIMNQVETFLPAYVALGGSKEDALDFMFAHKILRKIDGKYENYIGIGLTKLSKYLKTSYGSNKFKETQETIKKYQKKFM